MREIKAWDKINKKMLGISEIKYNQKGIVIKVVLFEWFYDVEDFEFYDRDIKDIVILQYTGLLDKNRKEIYGGDIFKTETGHVDFIRWIDELAGFFPFVDEHFNSEIEIIGNIYENKIDDFMVKNIENNDFEF